MNFAWTLILCNVSFFAVCTLVTIVLIRSAPKIEDDEPVRRYGVLRRQESPTHFHRTRFHRTRVDKRVLRRRDKSNPAVTLRRS